MWNSVSILVFCFDHGYECRNYSFFPYYRYFQIASGSRWFEWLAALAPSKRLARIQQKKAHRIKQTRPSLVIKADYENGRAVTFRLPPSKNDNAAQTRDLQIVLDSEGPRLYFSGWLFRNPEGIALFHSQMKERLRFKTAIQDRVEAFAAGLRKNCDILAGVHIRQGDYAQWRDGKYLVEPAKVRAILNSYMLYAQETASGKRVLFLLCSDGPVGETLFTGLPYVKGLGKVAHDLLSLSLADFIIGSDSTYGLFAAYYGNIPLVLFAEAIAWDQALAQKTFDYSKIKSISLHP